MSDKVKERNNKILVMYNKILNDDSLSEYAKNIINWLITENEQRRKDANNTYLKIVDIEKLLKERGFYKGI